MSRPHTPYGAVPQPNDNLQTRGYGGNGQANKIISDFGRGVPSGSSPLSQSLAQQGGFQDFDASMRGSSFADDGSAGLDRSASNASAGVPAMMPPRSNTLKKKASIRRTGSLKRSSSKRSLKAGSIAGFGGGGGGGVNINDDFNSVYTTPIPTTGTPTEILANRFQAWRQLLKSLITYFREIQSSYEMRSKALYKVQGTLANIAHPSIFVNEHGLGEATRTLDEYHKRSIAEANKSREIENDVIGALTGLRNDLSQKIKEIKSLSGDFKNSVEKEKESTRREIEKFQEALQQADVGGSGATGKNDPFVVKLGVDRMIEKQIDEENYLHRAYLNLESSGRELECIVVGEIQKAYNALAGILKREGDDAHHVVESLRTGPIAMPKDQEWTLFVTNDPHFVDPNVPLRRIEDIEYPSKHHPAAAEVRAGMLERKSKYLKSYTPGWYVLSATHLHEFKSADKIYSQPPVMSLYLPEQKLGSKSESGSSSYKFMLKGKQSGGIHKGHNWVFRAESHDTMLAWYDDLRNLTEKTGEERIAFVRKHARSVSGMSDRATISSDGFEDDEADAAPYSADAASLAEQHPPQPKPQRPVGGRFPSDLLVPRSSTLSASSNESEDADRDAIAASSALPGSTQQEYEQEGQDPYRLDGVASGTRTVSGSTDEEVYAPHVGGMPLRFQQQQQPLGQGLAATHDSVTHQDREAADVPAHVPMSNLPVHQAASADQHYSRALPPTTLTHPQLQRQMYQPITGPSPRPSEPLDHLSSRQGAWPAPVATGVAAGGAVALGTDTYTHADIHATPASAPEPSHPSLAAQPESQPSHPKPSILTATPLNVDRDVSLARPNINTGSTKAASPPAAQLPASDDTIGGPQREGGYETGPTFPLVRQDTNMSASNLHIPGEYDKKWT